MSRMITRSNHLSTREFVHLLPLDEPHDVVPHFVALLEEVQAAWIRVKCLPVNLENGVLVLFLLCYFFLLVNQLV